MITDEKQITIRDEEGNEHLMEILFTYDNEERKTSYVFFYDTEDPEQEVVVMLSLNLGFLDHLARH